MSDATAPGGLGECSGGGDSMIATAAASHEPPVSAAVMVIEVVAGATAAFTDHAADYVAACDLLQL